MLPVNKMKLVNPIVFHLKQSPENDQWWPLILFLSGFVVMAIWGNETTWLRDYVIGVVVLSTILSIVLWRKAKCTLTVDSEQLRIEVTKAGYRVPTGKTILAWEDLLHFDFGGSEEDTLELRWSNGVSQTFSGGDLDEFHNYLKKYFPEKNRRH